MQPPSVDPAGCIRSRSLQSEIRPRARVGSSSRSCEIQPQAASCLDLGFPRSLSAAARADPAGSWFPPPDPTADFFKFLFFLPEHPDPAVALLFFDSISKFLVDLGKIQQQLEFSSRSLSDPANSLGFRADPVNTYGSRVNQQPAPSWFPLVDCRARRAFSQFTVQSSVRVDWTRRLGIAAIRIRVLFLFSVQFQAKGQC